jgi:hypothetical protein
MANANSHMLPYVPSRKDSNLMLRKPRTIRLSQKFDGGKKCMWTREGFVGH